MLIPRLTYSASVAYFATISPVAPHHNIHRPVGVITKSTSEPWKHNVIAIEFNSTETGTKKQATSQLTRSRRTDCRTADICLQTFNINIGTDSLCPKTTGNQVQSTSADVCIIVSLPWDGLGESRQGRKVFRFHVCYNYQLLLQILSTYSNKWRATI